MGAISISLLFHKRFSTARLLIPRSIFVVMIIVAGGLLTSCNRILKAEQEPAIFTGNLEADQPASLPPQQNPARVDRQGAVEVAITPIKAESGSDDIIMFEVALNTHSVDLSMDLAGLSTLTTDRGTQLKAASWTGGSGHHVSGQLVFPKVTPDGTSLFDGAQQIILTIRNVDAPERVFVWQVSEIP
jgi:hypothetical protein